MPQRENEDGGALAVKRSKIATKEPASELHLSAKLYKRKRWVVAACPELDVWSQGDDAAEARLMIAEAVRIFIEECARMGTLLDVLREEKLPPVHLGRQLPIMLTFPDHVEVCLKASI